VAQTDVVSEDHSDALRHADSGEVGVESEDELNFAMYIALVVRNAMEDFHCKHLSDAQMQELNPLIRNAIFTALHAARYSEKISGARSFVEWSMNMIPRYWEKPELLRAYVRSCRDVKIAP
jgi:hypothetical protein